MLPPKEGPKKIGAVEVAPATFEAEQRPTGKLEGLEAWTQSQLKSLRQRKAKAFAELTPQQRRQKGSAQGPFDPNAITQLQQDD